MLRAIPTAQLLLILAIWGTAAPAAEDPACVCAEARKHHGWCRACEVGYVAGHRIESEMLFEALDAHGHDIDPRGLTCDSCLAAHADGGFCAEHGMGFVTGQAYMSRLSYELARGETLDVATLNCPACREHARAHGWCAECQRGMVGSVAIRDRAAYENAARAFRTLLAALEKVRECELCASAMVGDGRCPVCKISYKDGVGTPDP